MESSTSTLGTIIAIVADVFMVDAANLGPESSAMDVPGWDSVSQVALFMELEDRFRIELDVANASEAANLEALAAIVDAKRRMDKA
jgi:acyl carrier protein